MRNKLAGGIFVLLVSIHALVSLARIVSTSAPDFSVYFQAARSVASGDSPYETQGLFTGLGYPPFSLLPFLALAWLPYSWAQGVFVIGSFAALICLVYILLPKARGFSGFLPQATFGALAFLSFPVKFTLGMGQSNLVALLFLVAAFKYFQGFSAAVFLALAILLKPHFLIILPFLRLTGRKRELVAAVALLGAVVVLGGLISGWSGYARYFSVEAPALAQFSGREIYYNQGIASFFARLFTPDKALAMTLLVSVIAYTVNFLIAVRNRGWALSLALLTLLLVEPLSWQHHYVFLMPLFVQCHLLWSKLYHRERGLLVISYLLISVNIVHPENFSSILIGPLILSHVFIGTLLLWVLVLKLIRRRIYVP